MYIAGHDRNTYTQQASLNTITMTTVIIFSHKTQNILTAIDHTISMVITTHIHEFNQPLKLPTNMAYCIARLK
jgi:hypothetical protein